MRFKAFTLVAASILFVSVRAEAGLVDHGRFTADTVSGLDWLDFTETTNLSTAYVFDQFSRGGHFEGWRFARRNEVISLFDNAGATGPYNGSYSQASFNGAAPKLIGLMGATFAVPSAYSYALVHFQGDVAPELAGFTIREWIPDSKFDILDIREVQFATGRAEPGKAHALVRNSRAAIPEPSTVLLSAMGLILVARSRKRPGD